MGELNREWDEYVIAGNRISRDLESFDDVMRIAELPQSKVALHANGGTTYIDTVLPEEVMGVLKTIVTNQLVDIRTRKEIELKKHMNAWKPATVNPEFEQAVKEMEQQGKPKPEPDPLVDDRLVQKEVDAKISQPPLSADEILRQDIDTVRKLYEDDSVTVKEIANRYGVRKEDVYTFASKNRITRIKKPVGFIDSSKASGRERL